MKLDSNIEKVIDNLILAFKQSSLELTNGIFHKILRDNIEEIIEKDKLMPTGWTDIKLSEIRSIMENLDLIKEHPKFDGYVLTEKGIRFESFEKERRKEKITEEIFNRQYKQLKNTKIWMIIGL